MAKTTKKKEIEQMPASHLKMIWEYLTLKYSFFRNTIKGTIMWAEKDSETEYTRLTDEDLNTIVVDLQFLGFKGVSAENIQKLLFSRYTEERNPIQDYLNGLKPKRGAIAKLATTVKTTNTEMWGEMLPRWLVACVANVLNQAGCQNHLCLTFAGAQGKGKTTWQMYLCPPELEDYRYIGELDLMNKKDTMWKLAEYWFIIIEEQIKALNRQDNNTMKQLITLPDVKGRRIFARFDTHSARIGNFLASTNDFDILTDEDGSRRYLIFEAVTFDLPALKKIKIADVWAEAMTLYKEGFKYWIDGAEIETLKKYNKQFSFITDETEYVMQYIALPAKEADITHYLPSTVIRDYLQNETNCKTLRERLIGSAMNKLGFTQKSVRTDINLFPIKAWGVQLLPKALANTIVIPYLSQNLH